ncbi:hypothetical protein [Rhodoferax sp.]|uniref:hypothetical protein n=1 Tax=Rhodoferax sp. TaxID=50421 RepID=UPI00276017A5|nr:hypothetical protein [Rhodoferax sp.]
MKTKIVLASVVSALLAGCGGGGGGGSDGGAGLVPPVGASSIFAEPLALDSKCEIVSGKKTCDAPTSSRMSADKLMRLIADPGADRVRFKELGINMVSHALAQRAGDAQPWFAAEGWASYGGSEQEIVLGASALQFKGRTYTFSSTLVDEIRVYRGEAQDSVNVLPITQDGKGTRLIAVQADDYRGSTLLRNSAQMDLNLWTSYFGLLTDRSDVTLSTSETIKYAGTVGVMTGDGRPLGHDQVKIQGDFNLGGASCPIELTLNTRTGEIASSEVSCSDEAGGELRISLPKLLADKSRIRPLRASEGAAIDVPKFFSSVSRRFVGGAAPFKTDQIAGGIYGRNATELVIRGHGPQGVFAVLAMRQ